MLGKQHIRDGVATIKTEKTDTEVTIPISPELAKMLSIGPTGDLHFICNAHGKPFTKASFGNAFAEACRKAGIQKSAHGVRKYKATTAAYMGGEAWFERNGLEFPKSWSKAENRLAELAG